MEDFADANVMFGLMSSREGISRVERLLNEFEAHEAKEDRALEFYKQTLAHTPNPMTRFLMQLIVSDEEKHRAVVRAMAATLRGSLTWTRPRDSLEGPANAARPMPNSVRLPKSCSASKKKGSVNTGS
ncbi:MAG TPA: hypothetical protein VFV82_06955 [Candidatus Binatia bacterium]|nr:hypothetical protein [Candidatus Binatia bacterium]